MQIKPKNWSVFQHYKDRCPPWIKLHRDLLNNRDYMTLPLASKALAPLLWLLASEAKDGVFNAATEELMFRLHLSAREVEDGIGPLISKGFFIVDSGLLAPRNQLAIAETETEVETETETQLPKTRKRVIVRPACPADELMDLYHDVCPTLPRVMMLNDTRRRHLVSRWREVAEADDLKTKLEGLDIFRDFFGRVTKSDFLCGRTQNRGGRIWKASFDWLILPTNFLKVCEGQYDNGRK